MDVIKLGFYAYDIRGYEDDAIPQLLASNEFILFALKGLREEIVFTNKRIITLHIISGNTYEDNKNFSFYNYKKIGRFTIETYNDSDSIIKFTIGQTEYHCAVFKEINVLPIGRILGQLI